MVEEGEEETNAKGTKKTKSKKIKYEHLQVTKETKDRLLRIGTALDTHETLILKLINLYEENFGTQHDYIQKKFHDKYGEKKKKP